MDTMRYDSVVILFNPNSTGPSEQNAKDLRAALTEQSKQLTVRLVGTEYAGHGEELACKYAASGEAVLLVSSSGDGGYHELINGIMRADQSKSNVTVSLLPSGNANDHFSAVQSGDYIKNILDQNAQQMDIIALTSHVDGKPWKRYAHSYVGLGVSAHIARRLTKAKLNPLNEKFIVAKGLLSFRYVSLRTSEGIGRYSSLVFSNIDRMSKALRLSSDSRVDDGKIEVNEIRYTNIGATIVQLLGMVVGATARPHAVRSSTFTTVAKTRVQIDGEDYTLDADAQVQVSVVERAIKFVA